jgi:hypothetical protein
VTIRNRKEESNCERDEDEGVDPRLIMEGQSRADPRIGGSETRMIKGRRRRQPWIGQDRGQQPRAYAGQQLKGK